jgi:hypothetical protein
MKIYISLNLILPLVIFIVLNIQEDSVVDKLKIIILFFVFRKKYVNLKFFSERKTIYKKNVEK